MMRSIWRAVKNSLRKPDAKQLSSLPTRRTRAAGRLEEAIEAAQATDTVIHILLVVDPRYGGNPGVAHKLAEETAGA